MSGNVHQTDPAKLKGTVTQTEKDRTVTGTVDVEQSDPTKLKATVTQAAKDRTVTGVVTTRKYDPYYIKIPKTGFYTTQQSDTTLWNPGLGAYFVISDIVVSVDTAMRVYLKDDATKIFEWYFAANGGCVINLQTPYQSIFLGNVLSITTGAPGRCSITVMGYLV